MNRQKQRKTKYKSISNYETLEETSTCLVQKQPLDKLIILKNNFTKKSKIEEHMFEECLQEQSIDFLFQNHLVSSNTFLLLIKVISFLKQN